MNIFLAGFSTSPDLHDYDIFAGSAELFSALGRRDVHGNRPPLEYPNMIFLCHSAGGVLARHVLVKHIEAFRGKRIGIALIASPSAGSELARRLSPMARFYRAALPLELQTDSPTLTELDRNFKDLIHRPDRGFQLMGVEAYENRFVVHFKWIPLFKHYRVVDEASAGKYFGAPVHLAGTDHFTAVKPTSLNHPSHQLLVDFISRFSSSQPGNVAVAEPPSASLTTDPRSKFPFCEDYGWHRRSKEIIEGVHQRHHAYIWGPSGSGKTQMSIYALKEVGFPRDVSDSLCNFIHLELRRYKTLEPTLDALLGAIGGAARAGHKEERLAAIRLMAQKQFLAILFDDAELLSESEQRELHSLIVSLPKRARVIVTAFRRFPTDLAIEDYELGLLTPEEVVSYAGALPNSKAALFSEEHLKNLCFASKGHYSCIAWALTRAHSVPELLEYTAEIERGRGPLTEVVHSIYQRFPAEHRVIVTLLARYGGSVSNATLLATFPDDEVTALLINLANTPIATVHPSLKDGYIELAHGASEIFTDSGAFIEDDISYLWITRLIEWYMSMDEISGLVSLASAIDKDVYLLEQVFDWLRRRQLGGLANRLYRSTCELLFNKGFFEARIRCGEATAACLNRDDDLQSLSWVLSSFGSVKTLIGRYREASEDLTRALNIAEQNDFSVERLRARRALASMHYRRGEIGLASREITILIQDDAFLLDRFNEVDTLYVQAGIELFTSQIEMAFSTLHKMRTVSQEIKWTRGEAYADTERALILALSGELSAAQLIAEHAYTVLQAYGDRRAMGRCQLCLGKIFTAKAGKATSDFATGGKHVAEAHDTFLALRMDNEVKEAQLTIAAISEWNHSSPLPFRVNYAAFPMGGD